jgi:hypothetical protein
MTEIEIEKCVLCPRDADNIDLESCNGCNHHISSNEKTVTCDYREHM